MAACRVMLCMWLFLFFTFPLRAKDGLHEDTLCVLLAGDVMFDRGVREVSIPIDKPLRQQDEDFLVVNLETPICTRNTSVNKQIVFRSDTTCADLMHQLGITHAGLANNHSVDHGAIGLHETVRQLLRVGIAPMGYGLSAEERATPVLMKKGGVTVALFCNLTFPIENWMVSSLDGRPNISNLSVNNLCKIVRQYHQQHPEHHIVVFLHWGSEFHTEPFSRQRMEAVLLANAGAEAIVGHHPHVVQPMEMVGSVPVFYCVGNYLFDYPRPECRQGMIAKLRFTKAGLLAYEGIPVNIENCFPNREE